MTPTKIWDGETFDSNLIDVLRVSRSFSCDSNYDLVCLDFCKNVIDIGKRRRTGYMTPAKIWGGETVTLKFSDIAS